MESYYIGESVTEFIIYNRCMQAFLDKSGTDIAEKMENRVTFRKF